MRLIVLASVAALFAASPAVAQQGGYPAQIAGTWTGDGFQSGTDDESGWPMILHIYPDGAVATYPGDTACAAWWEITGGGAGHVTAIEHLVAGRDDCIDGLLVRVEGGEKDDLRITWSDAAGGVDSTASLTRQPEPE